MMMEESHVQRQLPFPSCFRLEYAREWGPCILGLDQAVRSSLPSLAPPVFCGIIVPCMHEPALQSLGLGTSGGYAGDHGRLAQNIQSDQHIAWILRCIPSEVADGARCSMGILEHTTASSIIKEALAAGIDIRGIRVACYSDPVRFRQFLFEAFPMIENTIIYPRVATPSSTSRTSSTLMSDDCSSDDGHDDCSMSSSRSLCLPQPLSVPPILCAAGVVAHSARDEFSRQLLFRQRHFHSPLARSPLSKSVNTTSHTRRSRRDSSSTLFGEAMCRCRPTVEEEESSSVRCSPYVGSEYGEAHSGLVSCSLPHAAMAPSPSSHSVPISMFDFYTDDDDCDIAGLTSPKRIRVVPCSPTLGTVFTCEDSMSCSRSSKTSTLNADSAPRSSRTSFDSCSPPYVSSSLLVSPPFTSSSASTSVPMYRPMFGITSPI